MSKNVLIFCDGTGQAGGIRFDEARTNVYKMYRAMRCGPDTDVDPAGQVAFYDPGLGSQSDGGHLVGRALRGLYNLVAQATGFGITRNIIDCYAAIIRLWEPGDRIYLFGFSRGAYTARCLAEVIALCGIPRRTKDGTGLKLDRTSVRRIAKRAVKHVYQFTAPRPAGTARGRQVVYEETRVRLAQSFRDDHEAHHGDDASTFPHFIGVFDTVAALIDPKGVAVLVFAAIAAVIAVAGVASLFSAEGSRLVAFLVATVVVAAISLAAAAVAYIWTHFKVDYEARGLEAWAKTAHFTDPWPKFYDDGLDARVGYARHAISLDENRADFKREMWRPSAKHATRDANGLLWMEQVWFAGNHADIGGGYPEGESRLSDIVLDWMTRCACEVPGDLRFDPALLRRWRSPRGPQHDEVASGFGWFTSLTGRTWKQRWRDRPKNGVVLHHTVYDRFEATQVMHWDGMRRYLPPALAGYPDVAAFYAPNPPADLKASRNSTATELKEAL